MPAGGGTAYVLRAVVLSTTISDFGCFPFLFGFLDVFVFVFLFGSRPYEAVGGFPYSILESRSGGVVGSLR